MTQRFAKNDRWASGFATWRAVMVQVRDEVGYLADNKWIYKAPL